MCEKCFQQGRSKFESYSEFDDFEKIIDSKIREGIFTINTENHIDNFHNSIYRCTYCNQNWCLSDPDNSWRGYFLRQKDAIDFENKIEREGKIRARGCIIFLVLLILAIIIVILV